MVNPAAGALAKHNEGERIPFAARTKFSFGIADHHLIGGVKQIAKNLVRSNAPEPIRRIAGVRLLPMQNGVPETTLV